MELSVDCFFCDDFDKEARGSNNKVLLLVMVRRRWLLWWLKLIVNHYLLNNQPPTNIDTYVDASHSQKTSISL